MCGFKTRAVEVELDASAVVSLLVSNTTSGDLSVLVDDCKDLLLRLPQATVSHCLREANFCVDALAKLGSSRTENHNGGC